MCTEKEIIEGCIKNNRKMQKILYDKYSAKFYAICLRYAKTQGEADDILQEGFIKIFSNISQFSQQHSFEGWMKRIVINTAITHYHQNLKHYYKDDIDEINEIDIENKQLAECKFSYEEMMTVINELADGYRMVFNLYIIEGYKHKEIAEMLSIDVATSKSQLHRAKKIVQEKLQLIAEHKHC